VSAPITTDFALCIRNRIVIFLNFYSCVGKIFQNPDCNVMQCDTQSNTLDQSCESSAAVVRWLCVAVSTGFDYGLTLLDRSSVMYAASF